VMCQTRFCPISGSNRTKVFHVKHFGTIDGLGKRTFAARWTVRSWDLGQAESCDRVHAGVIAVPNPRSPRSSKRKPHDARQCVWGAMRETG
jgi:hypothetical protein